MSDGPKEKLPSYSGRRDAGLARVKDLRLFKRFIEQMPMRPGPGIKFVPGVNGTLIALDDGERATRQLEVAGNVSDEITVYYGEAVGLGVNEVIGGMTENDFEVYDTSTIYDFYLKIQFTPTSQALLISDGNGEYTTTYTLGNGGTSGQVDLHVVTGGGAAPADQQPVVNSTTGAATTDGIYYIKFGHADSSGPVNSFYGPVGIGFCAPSSIKVWSMSQPET